MRQRLSYANVMATVAMFLALGGTSYAVAKLPRNSVGSAQVKDRSLQAKDLAAGVIPSASGGPRGPRGVEGPAGPAGTPGQRGPVGPSSVIRRWRTGSALVGFEAGASTDVITVAVPAGRWVVRAESTAIFFPNVSADADWFHCGLIVDGGLGGDRSSFTGNLTGASHSPLLTPSRDVTLSKTTPVTLRCWHEKALTAGSSVPFFRNSLVEAVETESLDSASVG